MNLRVALCTCVCVFVCMNSDMLFNIIFAVGTICFAPLRATMVVMVVAAAAAKKQRVKVIVPKIMCIIIIIAQWLFVETIEISFNYNTIIIFGKCVMKPICWNFMLCFIFSVPFFHVDRVVFYSGVWYRMCACVFNSFFPHIPYLPSVSLWILYKCSYFRSISFGCNILLLLSFNQRVEFRWTS